MMSRYSRLFLIIFSVGVALAGLISVQLYWAFYAYRLTEQEFNVNVNKAMRKTVDEINHRFICYETFSKVHLAANDGFYQLKQHWTDHRFLDPHLNPPDTIPTYYNNAANQGEFKWNSLMFSKPVNVTMVFQYEYTAKDSSLAPGFSSAFEKATWKNYHEAFSGWKAVEKKYDPQAIGAELKKNLLASSILSPYTFAYIDIENKTVAYPKRSADSADILRSRFRVPLTPSDYFSKPFDLALVFENENGPVVSAIGKLMALSLLVISILLICFFLFVRIILQQRKLSELKNDFINNITHEFKTPLTNISLAVETITEQRFAEERPEERTLRIIGQEAERLRENIERILQIAHFEKEKPRLSTELIDIHQLLKKVVSAFDAFSNHHDVIFHFQFSAAQNLVRADETQIFNLVYNLIDNAIKYNIRTPEITLITKEGSKGMFIIIKDNGIGINAADQKKIFDKFYRVQKGDLHDVKGYGLGLSYVKLITEMHFGTIKVSSQPGQGSEFELFIPQTRS